MPEDGEAWIRVTMTEESDRGTQGRKLTRIRVCKWVHWHFMLPKLRGGTAWIDRLSSFLPIDSSEFHLIVLSLTTRLIRESLPERPITRFLFLLHASFAMPRRAHQVLSEETFAGIIPGYLHLHIGLQVDGDPFEMVTRGEMCYSILRGWYISPWVASILTRNPIDGILLDTTWRVLRQYMTAILMAVDDCRWLSMAVDGNVGVPLGIAFGTAETVALYEQFYTALDQFFQLDLSQYIMESDQGPALCALCFVLCALCSVHKASTKETLPSAALSAHTQAQGV
jgi:hypothetical protein